MNGRLLGHNTNHLGISTRNSYLERSAAIRRCLGGMAARRLFAMYAAKQEELDCRDISVRDSDMERGELCVVQCVGDRPCDKTV